MFLEYCIIIFIVMLWSYYKEIKIKNRLTILVILISFFILGVILDVINHGIENIFILQKTDLSWVICVIVSCSFCFIVFIFSEIIDLRVILKNQPT